MKYMIILLGIVVLTGCSSTSAVKKIDQSQYCHTSSTTVLKDQTTSSSEVKVECSDKPNPKANFTAGMDGKSCGWARQAYPIAGKITVNYVMACQLQDGSWMYVPNYIAQ